MEVFPKEMAPSHITHMPSNPCSAAQASPDAGFLAPLPRVTAVPPRAPAGSLPEHRAVQQTPGVRERLSLGQTPTYITSDCSAIKITHNQEHFSRVPPKCFPDAVPMNILAGGLDSFPPGPGQHGAMAVRDHGSLCSFSDDH